MPATKSERSSVSPICAGLSGVSRASFVAAAVVSTSPISFILCSISPWRSANRNMALSWFNNGPDMIKNTFPSVPFRGFAHLTSRSSTIPLHAKLKTVSLYFTINTKATGTCTPRSAMFVIGESAQGGVVQTVSFPKQWFLESCGREVQQRLPKMKA